MKVGAQVSLGRSRPNVAFGSFATEASGFSACRCPLCLHKRPKLCNAAIGRDGPLGDIDLPSARTSLRLWREVRCEPPEDGGYL